MLSSARVGGLLASFYSSTAAGLLRRVTNAAYYQNTYCTYTVVKYKASLFFRHLFSF